MNTDLATFYLEKTEPNKSCLLALRDIILHQDTHIVESRKYGMPCFCYNGKVFCYLWLDKKKNEPYMLMVEGAHLHHPGLESGDRKRMKIFKVNPNLDLPLATLKDILNQALDVYRKNIIPIRKKR